MKVREAVDVVIAAYGHNTAHLDPDEQIYAATLLIRMLSETIEEIVADETPQA